MLGPAELAPPVNGVMRPKLGTGPGLDLGPGPPDAEVPGVAFLLFSLMERDVKKARVGLLPPAGVSAECGRPRTSPRGSRAVNRAFNFPPQTAAAGAGPAEPARGGGGSTPAPVTAPASLRAQDASHGRVQYRAIFLSDLPSF